MAVLLAKATLVQAWRRAVIGLSGGPGHLIFEKLRTRRDSSFGRQGNGPARDPHPRTHDRDDQQAGADIAPDAAGDRPRADSRGARRKAGDAARKSSQALRD